MSLLEPRQFDLRDGTSVYLRPITADDKEALREGLQRMSEESRYRRFMAPLQDLSVSQLKYLTEVDQKNHIAWVAMDPQAPGLHGVAVARCVRIHDADVEDVAEAAIAVVDSHQSKGLGTVLLTIICLAARKAGIKRFRGYVYDQNRPMLKMLKDMGAQVQREEGPMLRFDVELPESPESLPQTPTGRVFRAISQRFFEIEHPPLPEAENNTDH